MKHRTGALFLACAMLGASAANAQSWPVKPLRMIVAFPPDAAPAAYVQIAYGKNTDRIRQTYAPQRPAEGLQP